MLYYYHGQGFDSWTSRSRHRRCTEPSLPHRLDGHTKQVVKTRPASPTRSTCEDRFRERRCGTWVNVSGKKYFFTSRLLSKFPNSLLADPQKRRLYYDSDRDELFFDRNRIAFDSVYIFYQTSGILMSPDGFFPEQLLTDEFYFFGLYEYLSPHDIKFKLVTPSALKKQHIAPKRKCQRELWKICERPDSSVVARVVNLFSLIIIILSAVLLFVGTLPSFKATESESVSLTSNITSCSKRNFTLDNAPSKLTYKSIIYLTETGCIVWFTLELLVRFLVSPEKCQFLMSSSSIIDFIAITPFYISLFANSTSIGTSLYILRIIRLSRVFRVLKISRYTSAMMILGKTVKASIHDLAAMFFLIFIGTILFGSIAYYCEQWDEETKFHGIPHACWWAVVTISTVGYGDLVPTTLGGKIVGGVCSVSGVLLITPFLPIIFNKFNRFYQLEKNLTAPVNKSKEGEEESAVYPLELNSMIYTKRGRRFTM